MSNKNRSEDSPVGIETITTKFRPILVRYLDPQSILYHLMVVRFYMAEGYGNIHEASLRSSTEGMTLLLDAMEKLEPAVQKAVVKVFMSALLKSGNEFIHDVITGKEKLDNNWELYKTLLLTREDFMKIMPLQLMNHLPCLNDNDMERIRCRVENHGPMIGARELLLRLEAKPPSTLSELEKGLDKIGLPDMAREVGEAWRHVEEALQKQRMKEEADANNTIPSSDPNISDPQLDNASAPSNTSPSGTTPSSTAPSNTSPSGAAPSGTAPSGTAPSSYGPSGTASFHIEDSSVRSSEDVTGNLTREDHATVPPSGAAGGIDDMLQYLTISATRGAPTGVEGNGQQTAVVSPRLPQMDLKSLNLHNYQKELSEPALQDKNTIIVAPTGCGKTRVAIAIAMHVLGNDCSHRPHKVIFVVNKVALVEQQRNAFKQFINDVVGISGDMSSQVPLTEQLGQALVIVLTAQIMVNALQDGSFSLSSVGLLILDECHNTQKGNAYNTIMACYRDLKRENPNAPRPQVVGLTASLGVKKSKRQRDAEDHVLKLCANLDAQEISTVKTHIESLENSYHRPKEETFSVRGRDEQDPFKCVIGGIMDKVETTIFSTEEGKEIMKKNREMRELSSNRGMQQYEGELSKLSRYIPLNVTDPQRARALLDCANFLEMYNQSLYINRDARTIDALNYIDSYIKNLRVKNQHEGGLIPRLISLFENQHEELERICQGLTNENPVLKKLEEILESEYEQKPETLAILFTNTRASTRALEAWIQASQRLQHLNPGTLTGTGGGGGMTQPQQEKLLAMFKEKKHKLVISTSVAEEGLDIQMCNLVVRYNYVRDDIGRVQARGRSRAEGGKFYLIFNTNLPNLAERERMNKIRENMMKKATAKVCEMIHSKPQEYNEIVETLQREDLSERKLRKSGKAAAKKREAASRIQSEITLLCRHCHEFICFADDVRCINQQHHIVMDKDLTGRTTRIDLEEKKKLTADATATKEIQCKKCKKKLGYSMIYRGHELPLLSIDCLLIVTSKGVRDVKRKWKEVPFQVKSMDLEDLSQRLGNADEEEEVPAVGEKDIHEKELE